jgi:hypothetical protein
MLPVRAEVAAGLGVGPGRGFDMDKEVTKAVGDTGSIYYNNHSISNSPLPPPPPLSRPPHLRSAWYSHDLHRQALPVLAYVRALPGGRGKGVREELGGSGVFDVRRYVQVRANVR